MRATEGSATHAGTVPTVARGVLALTPLAMALAYPALLRGFHAAVAAPAARMGGMSLWAAAPYLIAMFALPLLGLVWAGRIGGAALPSRFELHALRLAYASIAAPPLYVLTGVVLGLLGGPVTESAAWFVGWLLITAGLWFAGRPEAAPPIRSVAAWRVMHGVAAALIACFVLFHLTNHLLGWLGPAAHAATMRLGRSVYRSSVVEPVLVLLLLFQVFAGARLAWRWSGQPVDAYRVFQIGSGVYLAAFLLTHLNSALVSARAMRGIDTNWAWASGAPDGLIFDAWNIRLVPHYALGVFFVLAHLASGLRQVLLAHDVHRQTANRLWSTGLALSGLTALAILAALCGARI